MTSSVIQPGDIREVAVIGLGLMGSGIAELIARSGRSVAAIEVNQSFLDQGMARLHASLDRAVSRGRLTDTARDEILARIRPTDDIAAGVAGADLVIEAIPERIELKKTLFAQLDEACRADAILATNTSSLSVTEIAGGTRDPARVAGLHFFNPAPVMKLVEVISTVLTSPETAETLARLSRDLGKTPVAVTDRAGFIVNALLLPYLNHAVHLLETAQATREDIDKAATVGLGLPMGPLTLLDLIGLDTCLAILETLQDEFGGTRYVHAPLLRKLCDARLLGRKSGRGFYDYQRKSAAADHELTPVPAEVALIREQDGRLDELAGQITAAGSLWRRTRASGY
jgi:3-hydroxybutyryl-CoA dehydrogenase